MDGSASSPGHDCPSGVPLGVGIRPAPIAAPFVHPTSTASSRTHPGLGQEGCRRSCTLPTLFSLSPDCCASSRWPPSSPHNRFIPSEPAHPRPDLQSRQPHDTCSPPHASCLSRLARHSRGVHPYSHAAKSQTIFRFFLPLPTVFFFMPFRSASMSLRLYLHRSSLGPSSACGTAVFPCWRFYTTS